MNRLLAVFLMALLLGCTSSSTTPEQKITDPTKSTAETKTPPVNQDSPKDAIAHQIALIKDGKADELLVCFTERLRDQITPEAVKEAQEQLADMTLEDLVDQIEEGEDEGVKTAVIKMKNGRKLTTLLMIDGQWQADTIWFR
jgi:hypothetical protein